jgi:hypothetical protein
MVTIRTMMVIAMMMNAMGEDEGESAREALRFFRKEDSSF